MITKHIRLSTIFLLLGLFQTAAAQNQPPLTNEPDDGTNVIVTGASDADFPEIAVEFEVKRKDGSFLLDATGDDFQIQEDGSTMTIARFEAPTSRELRPTTILLVVDRSGSMGQDNRIGAMKQAVGSFLEGLPKGSKVAMIAFGSSVDLICPLTTDFSRVRAAVNELRPDGDTKFLDGVDQALDLLADERGRRAVLALTDGQDTSSQHANIPRLINKARKLGLPVHTLAYGLDDENSSNAMRLLAESTRGNFYEAGESDQLRSIYEEIARRLRSSYTAVYTSDRKIPDGTLRPVSVIYRLSRSIGKTDLFIPGMVVPASGWSGLFLTLIGGLWILSFARRRRPMVKPSA